MQNSSPAQTGFPQTKQDSAEAPLPPVIETEGDLSTDSTSPAHAIWIFLTLLACALLFYFGISLWYRWLRPNPQFLSFLTSIAGLVGITSLLSLQTRWGARVAKQAVQALGLGGWAKHPWKILLTVGTITMILGALLYIGSPKASNYFNRQGKAALDAGLYSQAILFLRQAISLSDKNTEAHFHLGTTYEQVRNFEQAVAEYQVTLELDDQFGPAYNNLGRLYLVAYKDPDSALLLLQNGLALVSGELDQAVLQKNLGWAYLEKNLPKSAKEMLEKANLGFNELRSQGYDVSAKLAETHRLTALAYEKLGQFKNARQAWNNTLSYASSVSESASCTKSGHFQRFSDCANTLFWTNEARERLNPPQE